MKEKNLKMTSLVGYQTPTLYAQYREEVLEMLENEKDSSGNIDLEWLLCKVFMLGSLVGVRKERQRRKKG